MPNGFAQRFGLALRAATGASGDADSLQVLMHADWRSGEDLWGRPILVGLGSPNSKPFNRAAQIRVLEWLQAGSWMDAYALADEPPADLKTMERHLLEFVRAHGAVTVELAGELTAIEQRRHALATFPKVFGLTGRWNFTDVTGTPVTPEMVLQSRSIPVEWSSDGPRSSSPEDVPGATVQLVDLLADLCYLRVGLLLTFAARSADATEIQRAVDLTRSLGMGETSDDAESEPERDLDVLARVWMVHKASELRAEARFDVLRPFAPATIGVRPTTPLQLLWLSLAVAGGAVEPPIPIDGFYRCSYPPCQRLFHSPRRRTKGENVFCSKRCGQSFWATKRVKEMRAADRERKARDRGGEQDEQTT